MKSASTNPQKKQNATFPPTPTRGRIKAQIFESLVDSVSSMASKAGEALSKLKGTDGVGSSASTTPPPSPIQTPSSDGSPAA